MTSGFGRALVLGASTLLLGGCSSATIDAEPAVSPVACVDDSKACVDQRQAHLRTLLADKSRSWVAQPASVESYAGGVRLFAFKTEKARLSCQELGTGIREADAAPAVLRGQGPRTLNPGQISRGIMFAAEVGKDLRREAERRCRG